MLDREFVQDLSVGGGIYRHEEVVHALVNDRLILEWKYGINLIIFRRYSQISGLVGSCYTVHSLVHYFEQVTVCTPYHTDK